MRTTNEFLDAVRERHGLTSDHQLAKFFGVRQSTISNYRGGKSRLDESMAMRVADALELAPAYVMACIAAERTHNERARREWTALAKKLLPAAVATLLLTVSGSALLSDNEPGALLAWDAALRLLWILC